MNCKDCLYEGTDAMFCCKVKLKEAWNDFLKEVSFLRRFAEDKIECTHREDSYLAKARKDINRYG